MSQAQFNFKSFSILNPQKGLKVTTDACLIGAVAEFISPNTILDIGCGSGVISLMLAQKYPNAHVLAIDIDEYAIEIAKKNIGNSGFLNSFSVIHDDFLKHKFEGKIDLLVCNPPYYKNYLQNIHSDKRIAIHNTTLDFKLLIDRAYDLMHNGSMFWLILPPYEMKLFLNLAKSKSMNILSYLSVFNQSEKHFRDIVCLSLKSEHEPKINQLLMFDMNNQMTKEYQLLMSPFYLDK